MVSPVGDCAAQTFTSVRAGITRMRERPDIYSCLPEDPTFDDREPLVASAMRYLEEAGHRRTDPAEWLGLMAGLAFRDLWRQAGLTRADEPRAGLFLSLPPARLGWDASAKDPFAYHFRNFAQRDSFPLEQLLFHGPGGPLLLCEQATALLRSRQLEYAIIGGVDSYLFPGWLEPLDQDYRVKSRRNIDGFIPGEAAAFFLLERSERARTRKAAPLAYLAGAASARFEAGKGLPNTGVELAGMIGQLGDREWPLIVCDLNGEPGRVKEWGWALSRLSGTLDGAVALEHPAIALGDIGAASGAALVALAVQYLRGKHRDRKRALVWTSGDDGDRRALLLEKAAAPEEDPWG
jgi:3-oxoacyl-[acyl-carrier-protein] synthase-1